ncbi:Trehalose 6-phosphatase [Modestobacter italicus]|uniref:Trehalose 6-phosphate phosphatase n=1 Tax=Modestobacter italicus (strain DSM 44449 / CECT 9708 / BC 501) TaxID=2732864 RepID=I4F5I0_MODI5|nr:trehalose-phosphatase [Modestobacter marinus]CCH90893.1 Trehalose 6-phosphatase [Modestobacter marinus]
MPDAALDAGLGAALDELARRRPLLLASDYDGVLARLRDDPAAAVLEPGIGALLGRLAAVEGVTVALVSGRGVEDLRRTSGLTGPFRWVGSHGAEFDGPLSGELAGRRDALAAALAPLVDAVPGARLEVKPASAAVHVRTVADRAAAQRLLADAAAGPGAAAGLTAKPGKDVLELAVTDADKGSALLRLRDELGAAGVLYLGDDVTDEDAFRALGAGGESIKVGSGDTAAGHRVEDLAGVRAVLERLVGTLSA